MVEFFKEVLAELGFIQSRADPCLFIKNQDGCKQPFLIIYVDDGGSFTAEEKIQPIHKALSKIFVVKDLGPIATHFLDARSKKIRRKIPIG